MLSRRSYEQRAESMFDNPFASRFDENDAVIYFDNVHVPWERVFVDRDIAMCQKQFHATPAHVYQNYQAQIRLRVKLRFLVGVARRHRGDQRHHRASRRCATRSAKWLPRWAWWKRWWRRWRCAGPWQAKYFVPHRHTLYAAQVITQKLYGRVISTLRELAGGGLIMQPSSVRDFAIPELAALIEADPAVAGRGRSQQGQVLPPGVGRDRLRIRLAPRAVRDVLRRRTVRDARPFVPHLRLGRRHRPGRHTCWTRTGSKTNWRNQENER